jgi:hypothetical protein
VPAATARVANSTAADYPKSHGMALPNVKATASSDYGSDIDLQPPSEYGSEFDEEDVNEIGDLLSHIASTAPVEKAVVVHSHQDHDSFAPFILVHASASSAIARLGDAPGGPTCCGPSACSPYVEMEYNSQSRDAWSGKNTPSALYYAKS